nr:DUF1080 domain-containing protein [Muricauda sp. SK9]
MRPNQRKSLSVFTLLVGMALFIACKNQSKPTEETTTAQPEEKKAEWVHLFDGTSLEGWRGYNMDSLP